ncbi:hypothetical protein HK100_005130, partial [Physocladia obscura]
MEVQAQFAAGTKAVLVAILRALKDLGRSNTLSLRFSEERGLNSHFSCGPSGDAKAAFLSFRLFPHGSHHHEPQDLHDLLLLPVLPSPLAASLFSALTCNPETVNTNDDSGGLSVSLAVHPKTIFQQLELVDEFDRVEIRAEKADVGCELYFESLDLGRKVLYEMDFVPNKIDPIVHRLPIPPPAGYAFIVQIEAKEYVRTIAALHDASDRVTITGSKNKITFEASGTNGTLQVGLSQKHFSANPVPRCKILVANSTIQQTFSTRYLLAFAHAVHLGTYVVLSFPANPSVQNLEVLADQSHMSPKMAAGVHSSNSTDDIAGKSNSHVENNGSSASTPHPVAPLRPPHSHLRISHPIQVLPVSDPLNIGSDAQAFKLTTATLSSNVFTGFNSSTSANTLDVCREIHDKTVI